MAGVVFVLLTKALRLPLIVSPTLEPLENISQTSTTSILQRNLDITVSAINIIQFLFSKYSTQMMITVYKMYM